MNVRFLCKFSEKGAEKFTAMYLPTKNIFNARNMKGEIINESFPTEKSDSVILGSALILGTVLSVLPSAIAADETIATNGNGGKTDVGVWYTTYNTNNFWGTNGRFSDPENPAVGYKALHSDGTYGPPNSGSADEIDFQLEKWRKQELILLFLTLLTAV